MRRGDRGLHETQPVAYALARAASRLFSTPISRNLVHACSQQEAGVEKSLDAARTSAYVTMTLFDITPQSDTGPAGGKRPLADRLRPERLEDYVGQEQILAPANPVPRPIDTDTLRSSSLLRPPPARHTT